MRLESQNKSMKEEWMDHEEGKTGNVCLDRVDEILNEESILAKFYAFQRHLIT